MHLTQIYGSIGEDLARIEVMMNDVSQVDLPWLAQMLEHSIKGGGKRIRPALNLLSGKFYDYNLEALLPMAQSIELMHTATLVHDDAIDKSFTRRGRATVNKLWGMEQAVLLGDYLFARAGDSVADTHSIRAIKLFCQTLMIISRGELDQARNAFNINQAHEQYLRRIFAKTASLFSLSTESGGILSNAPEESIRHLRNFGCNLGIAFQIVDDILDFTASEQELGKPAGSDLAQGTLTLPAMLLMEQEPEGNPVKRFFQNPETKENVKLAIQQVRDSAIVDKCYTIARSYCSRACSNLAALPESPSRRILKDLADFVVERKK